MAIRYATRADVLGALDLVESARLAGQVDRALDAASASIESLCHRRFYPWVGSRDLEVRSAYALSCAARLGTWREYLGETTEATTITGLTLDGAVITEWWAGPQDPDTDTGRAPYTYLDLGAAASGTLTISGTFGACAATAVCTTLGGALSGGSAQCTVADSSACSPGALLRVDSEWLAVVGATLAATGQALTAGLGESLAEDALTVADPTVLAVGEILTVGTERMRVENLGQGVVQVERAWGGSTLAVHGIGAAIYAPRTLTVERGACGSTAISHSSGAAVLRHVPPGLIRQLAVAEALNTLAQESSSYARAIGSGESARNASGAGLMTLRAQVRDTHGRTMRLAAI
jgi:hypothetical protein